MEQVLAITILAVTVGLALARFRVFGYRMQPDSAALLGAVTTVAVGLVPLSRVGSILEFLSHPILTLVSLMVVTIVADQSGLFRVLAWWVARAAGGSGHRLFSYLFFVAAATGAVFTNDAAVLIFTPLVYRLIEDVQEEGGWTLAQKLPFYFAILYVANLVGPLLISNPIHLVVARWWEMGFVEHALWMTLPALAGALVTWGGLWLFFRRQIPRRYRMPDFPKGVHRRFATVSAVVLSLTLIAFFAEVATGLPVAWVAAASAVVLLVVQAGFTRRAPIGVAREISWDAILFVIGIFVVANGLRAAGVTDVIGQAIDASLAAGEHASNLVTGYLAGGASALINNHPVADTMAIAILDLDLPAAATRLKVFSLLIGGDLGPKMLPIGSLAALIWFRLLRNRGVDVSYWLYIRIGVPVTLAAIFVAIVVLGIQAELFG